jgi:hypothetical protein
MTVSATSEGKPANAGAARRVGGGTCDLASRQAVLAALENGSTDPSVHAAALRLACAADADPELDRSRGRYWILGLNELIEHGELEAATYAVPLLNTAFPDRRFLENMAVALDRLPPLVDNGREAFVDDPEADVQLVRMPDADAVVIDFCGAGHGPGLPIYIMDRWWAALGAHVIYLRDRSRVGYTKGIPELGDSVAETSTGLKKIIESLGVTRVTCVGASAGASGALRYAVSLGADRVLAMAPITGGPKLDQTVDPPLELDEMRGWGDLVPLYREPTGVRARIVYGEKNAGDTREALRMAGLPGVTLEALVGWEAHLLFVGLHQAGLLDQVLRWLVALDDVGADDARLILTSGLGQPASA